MQNDQTKLQLLIERLRMECVSSFEDNLLGIYLHGSVAMVRARGIAIMGKKTEQLFVPIPREWMLDYLQAEMQDAVIRENENPVYCVLNACRALAFLEKNELLSKQEGGEWGIQYFPEKYTSLLKAVLTAYGGGPTVRTADYPIPEFWLEVKKRWQKGGIVTGYLFGADGYNGPWNNR